MKEAWILCYSDEDQWGRSEEPEFHGVVTTLQQKVDWCVKGYNYYTIKTKIIKETEED